MAKARFLAKSTPIEEDGAENSLRTVGHGNHNYLPCDGVPGSLYYRHYERQDPRTEISQGLVIDCPHEQQVIVTGLKAIQYVPFLHREYFYRCFQQQALSVKKSHLIIKQAGVLKLGSAQIRYKPIHRMSAS